jgi:hypothetical protein
MYLVNNADGPICFVFRFKDICVCIICKIFMSFLLKLPIITSMIEIKSVEYYVFQIVNKRYKILKFIN